MKYQYEYFLHLCRDLSGHMNGLWDICNQNFKLPTWEEGKEYITPEDTFQWFRDYIDNWSQLQFYTDGLFQELLTFDQIARKAIINKCITSLSIEIINKWGIHYKTLCSKIGDRYIRRSFYLYLSLYHALYKTALLFDIQILDVYSLECVTDHIMTTGENRRYYFTEETTNKITQEESPIQYTTLPRTYRIAAVKSLIDKSGLCKNIDKTRIAEFVEAVTGGNIETKGKDTVSYKKPTADAIARAEELLKKIGI